MFKLIFIVVLVGAMLGCAAYDFLAQRKIEERQRQIVEKRAELQKLAAIDQEVQEFLKRKDYLEARIDRINQLKQNQKGPGDAPAMVASLAGEPIDSVAILDPKTLVINGSAEATKAVERLRQSAPQYTFMFRGTR